jgi:hypothetical protein
MHEHGIDLVEDVVERRAPHNEVRVRRVRTQGCDNAQRAVSWTNLLRDVIVP